MTDIVYSRRGTNSLSGHAPVRYHDEGDSSFSESVAAHLRGWDSTDGAWYRLPVDHATGALLVKASLTASAIDIGTVDQGTGGSSAWKVDGTGGTFPVTGAFWQVTQPVSWASPQHVIVDTAPSTPVTGPLTDTQLRASAVPVSLATLPALAAGSAVIGHVIVDTAPSTAVTNTGTFAVQASLAAETTKVIGVTRSADGSGSLLSSTGNALDVNVKTDAVGLAKDASLTTIFGTPTSDSPGAFTVLDQLSRIRKTEEQNSKTLQALLALQSQAPARKTQPTLLHRS